MLNSNLKKTVKSIAFEFLIKKLSKMSLAKIDI